MASFRKRGPYQWQAQVRKTAHPTQTKTFETRAEAEKWARGIEVEIDTGTFVSRAEAEPTTLHELLERYLEEVTPFKKGAASETNRLRAMMRHPLARRFVAGIRGMDIARWRDERLCKVSPATVKRGLMLLGHVFEVARKEWGIYMHNPVRDIRLPPSGRPRERRLPAGEEARLFEACRKGAQPMVAAAGPARAGNGHATKRTSASAMGAHRPRRAYRLPAGYQERRGADGAVVVERWSRATLLASCAARGCVCRHNAGSGEALLHASDPTGRHQGPPVPRLASRGDDANVREGTEHHGGREYHRTQGSEDAPEVHALESRGFGAEVGMTMGYRRIGRINRHFGSSTTGGLA